MVPFLQLLRAKPAFSLFLAGQGLLFLSDGVWSIALYFLAMSISATPASMGLVLAFGGIPSFLFNIASGAWVDRMPVKKAFFIANGGRMALMILISLLALNGSLNISYLCVFAFIESCLTILHSNAAHVALYHLTTEDEKPVANSLWEISFSLFAAVLASLVSGYFISIFGIKLLPLAFALAQLFFMVVVRKLPDIGYSKAANNKTQPVSKKEALAVCIKNPNLIASLIVLSAVFIAVMAVNTHVIFYLGSTLQYSPKTVGLIMGIIGFVHLATSLIWPTLLRWFSLERWHLLAGVIGGAGLLLISLSSNPFVLVAGIALSMGVAQKITRVLRLSMVQKLAPAGMVGQVAGLYGTIMDGLDPLTMTVYGLLASSYGYPVMFGAAFLLCSSGCIYYFFSPLWRITSNEAKQIPAV